MTTILSTSNLTKKYKENTIIDHVNMEFEKGYIHLLNGNNGSGKSTFLKMLYGLLVPDEGKVFYDGNDIEKIRMDYLKKIGIVNADERSLYHKLTAYENLYYVGRIFGVNKHVLDMRIKTLLEQLKLDNDRTYVEDFSTGMKKKVMVARAFINEPEILFADEVMNGLDVDTCRVVENMFQEFVKNGKTIFLVSHTGLKDYSHVKEYLVEDKKVKCYVESSKEVINH